MAGSDAKKGTLELLLGEIAEFLKPFADALAEGEQGVRRLFREAGINLDKVLTGGSLGQLIAIGKDIRALYEFLRPIAEGEKVNPADIEALLQGVKGIYKKIQLLDGTASLQSGIPKELNNIGTILADRFLIVHLQKRHPKWMAFLILTGVIDLGGRPQQLLPKIWWERLSLLVSDPEKLAMDVYSWGNDDFKAGFLLSRLRSLIWLYGIPAQFIEPNPSKLMADAAKDPLMLAPEVRFPLWMVSRGEGELAELGVTLLPLAKTSDDKPGIGLLPFGVATASEHFELSDNWSLIIKASVDALVPYGISFRPPSKLELKNVGDSVKPSSVSVSIELDRQAPKGEKELLLGSPEGSRLEIDSAGIRVGAEIASTKNLYVEFICRQLNMHFDFSTADSFLKSLLPQDGLDANFDLTVGLSSTQGLYFSGSGGLQIELPTHISLGPVEFNDLFIITETRDSAFLAEISCTISAGLGPLYATAERLGIEAELEFPEGGGNLGPADLALDFKPPSGIGLAINAGVVKGGGYLYFDFDKEEYAGVLELSITKIVTVKAIGLITTKLPGGKKGFSMLIIITAEFDPGLQLGLGFTLLCMGGLLGLNRTMNLQPLMDGVRTGSVQSIMFPENPVANAPRIISDLRTVFPPYEGKFLIGPMAKLGWGTPAMVSVSLGVIIEIPGNIAIVGVLKVALPDETAALIVIQAAFAGAIEFDKKRLYFFASMFDSRVLFITLEGEIGLLVAWGDDPNFVLSVGGFHPRFNPPPLPFPNPKRICVSIANTDICRIRAEGYFAVTSNSVQFGARAELKIDVGVASVEGHVSFDALFRFSPFYFCIEISAGVSLKVFGVGLFSISLHFALEGPAPWRASGTGTLTLLFFDVSADFDITWGESSGTSLPPISVMPLLAAELAKDENWLAEVPPKNNLLVSLRKLPEARAPLVLHPVGALRVSQRAVPLGLKIDKVGNQKPSDADKFTLAAISGLVKAGDTKEQFAKAQFVDMSDSAKVSQRAYDPLNGGLRMVADGGQLGAAKSARRNVRYEQIIIDGANRRLEGVFKLFPAVLFAHFMKGAAVSRSDLSQRAKAECDPFSDHEKVRMDAGGFTVAYVENNRPFGGQTAHFDSETLAEQFLEAQVAGQPALYDALHVIPLHEAA